MELNEPPHVDCYQSHSKSKVQMGSSEKTGLGPDPEVMTDVTLMTGLFREKDLQSSAVSLRKSLLIITASSAVR